LKIGRTTAEGRIRKLLLYPSELQPHGRRFLYFI
jgi:hypothetical protein